MSLKEYAKKRSFDKTPEPAGGKKGKGSALIFVVQKHAASHLHYDFRLEVEGVLKSWAVPKGPSLNPKDKRLAMMVEDHPYDYRDFEGRIPEGNYGAGTVIVWDTGVYQPVDESHEPMNEKDFASAIRNGKATFFLLGEKLEGLFSLVKMKHAHKPSSKDNEWLLIKKSDKYASTDNILEQDRSVLTKRTLDQIGKDDRQWTSHKTQEEETRVMGLYVPGKAVRADLQLTNQDKVFWPKEKYTKGNLLEYYRSMSRTILPYLKDRPESLHRFPNGIKAADFYQKNMDDQLPDWVPSVRIQHSQEVINYLMISNEKTLLYAINLGCIDLNPFNSRVENLENPDYLVIDLDPEDISFDRVVETALTFYELLSHHDIPCYCKTSGATGLHIYLPLKAKYPYETVRQFAQLLAEMVHQQLPRFTSLERNPSKRQKKVYLDYLQNSFGKTMAAAYSVRPRPGATVSTPLDWKEVKEGLDPSAFTIKTIPERVKKKGDLFKGVLGKGIDLLKCLKKLSL